MRQFAARDGARLAYEDIGEGQPVVLVHGFLSNHRVNWIDFGAAQQLLDAGLRLIMPDLRGHGQSEARAAPLPPDVLALDLIDLAETLELKDFTLCGYSLGGRTVLRAMVQGLKPARAVISGMGLEGVVNAGPRTDWFIRTIEQRDQAKPLTPEGRAVRFLRSTGTDPDAAIAILRAQVSTTFDELAGLTAPCLVLCGEADADNGSAADLAQALPEASYQAIPGDHMSAITKPEFGAAIAAFLQGRA